MTLHFICVKSYLIFHGHDIIKKVRKREVVMAKKRFGDRRDARLVRDLNPVFSIMSRIKPSRADSDVYLNQKVDITKLVEYMEDLKKKDPNNYPTYFHVFCYALVRTIYLRPHLNRYIANYKTYERNDVSLGFVAKTSFEDHADELLTNIKVEENYTLNDVRKAIGKSVEKMRSNTTGSTDNLINFITKLPGFIMKMIVGIIKFMDRHDFLPRSLCDSMPYYCSVFVSNIGVLKCDAIYHNITNFGTNGFMVMIGEIKEEYIINAKGKPEKKALYNIWCQY